MKYKPGDKVKIKTWEQIKKQYEALEHKKIPVDFIIDMEKDIRKLCPNRIVTIDKIEESFYIFKESKKWSFNDNLIEGLVEEPTKEEPEPITSRLDILDIRD